MKYEHIHKELLEWKEENIITPEQFDILDKRYKPEEDVIRFYSKISSKKISIFFMSILIILGSLAWIGEFFSRTNIVVSNMFNDFVAIAGIIFLIIGTLYFGDYLSDRKLNAIKYIGKCITIVGGLITTFIIFYIDFKIYNRFGIKILGNDWALFMLISSLILVFIVYKIREKALLYYLITLLYIWFISEGKIITGSYSGSIFGITLPARLILFSLIFVLLGYLHKEKINNYKIFSNTYYVFGFTIMFVSSFLASIGIGIKDSIIPLRIETLLYLLITLTIIIYTTYTLGLMKNSLFFLKLGLVYFGILVYGNFYRVFQNNILNPLALIILVILSIIMAIVVEYVIVNRNELRKDILK